MNSRPPHHAATRAQARYQRTASTPSRRKKAIKITLFVILAIVVWFGVRSAIVAFNLYSAKNLLADVQTQASAGDFEAVSNTMDDLQFHTASAAAGTFDPTWRAAEFLPFAGTNLHAVRMLAESANDIVVNVASPAVDVAASIDLTARNPENGGFDLTPLQNAKPIAAAAGPVFADSASRIDSINESGIVGPLKDIVDQIGGIITDVAPIAESAEPLLNLAGAALGDTEPRNYLLAFQNNAESTALGGSAASYTLIHTDNGSVTIADQANSGDFEEGIAVDVPVDQSAIDLYGSYLIDHINTSTSRPDFPTAASIMQGFWQRDRGVTVDGVISLDPIALALMLEATGDIPLNSGDVLTSDNAVDLLTNGVYMRYPDNEDQPLADAFFAEAASTIVGKVMSADFDIPKMVTAVSTGVEQGDIMMWNSRVEEQSSIDGMKIQGTLPADNSESTAIGVYYRDTSASKIDYYLETGTSTTSDICSAPVNPSFSTTVRLTSTLTREESRNLPEYVASRDWGGTKFRTEVFVYGPVGGSVTGTTVTSEGLETVITPTANDLNRPVATFFAYLAPGETTTVNVSFVGPEGAYGPLEVVGTPMINPTNTVVDAIADCG